jgi:hypothetical protein
MDPQLEALAAKYSERLMFDAAFVFRVKTLYKVMRLMSDPEVHPDESVKVKAYLTACVLEESQTESHGHPGVWR